MAALGFGDIGGPRAALGEELLDAARSSNATALRQALRRGAPIGARSETGETALHQAARAGSTEVVGLLLDFRAPLDATCARGRTPLDVATEGGGGRPEVALLLMERSAALSTATPNIDATSLHYAARTGITAAVRAALNGCEPAGPPLMLAHGLVQRALRVDGPTPLQLALQYSRMEAALLLLQHRAMIETEVARCPTALHYTAWAGSQETVEALLHRGAACNAGAYGEHGAAGTPLHVAVESGCKDVASTLLQHRADVGAGGRGDGRLALDLAVQGRCRELVELLLSHGAGANESSKDPLGHRPLLSAAESGDLEVSKLLLAHSARADLAGGDGRTPLHVASRLGDAELVALLLKHKARPDAADGDGETPLHLAARFDRPEVTALLLRNRASTEIREPRNGHTPLHVAALYNSVETGGALLQGQADWRASCDRGYTPIEVATKHEHTEFTKLLLEASS